MPSPAPMPTDRLSLLPLPRTGAGFALPPRTLLLVEDSRLAAEAVRLLCRRLGIRLRRTESLAGAALHLRVYRPDIALIDLGLPDGSGLSLISALARSMARPQRLVAISGDARLEEASIDAGADSFLLKPVSLACQIRALTGEAAGDDLDGAFGGLRNAGADPLALRDDLALVQDLLDSRADAESLRYAGQFCASIGRSLDDEALSDAAETATRTGDRRLLADALRDRIASVPLI